MRPRSTPSRFVSASVTPSLTDVVLRAATTELERQRPALDAMKNVRVVAIRVRLPVHPVFPGPGPVTINFETERT